MLFVIKGKDMLLMSFRKKTKKKVTVSSSVKRHHYCAFLCTTY